MSIEGSLNQNSYKILNQSTFHQILSQQHKVIRRRGGRRKGLKKKDKVLEMIFHSDRENINQK